MEDKPHVIDPDDVKEVLQIMKQEFVALMGIDEKSEYYLIIHMLPCYLPGSGSYEAINGFNLILDGACARSYSTNTEANRVSVIELVEDEGDIKRHSYIITPVKFKGIFSSLGSAYYSYFFIQPATSGYSGTGPEIQQLMQASIDEKIPAVRQKVAKVRSLSSLTGLFYERGPIVNVAFPGFEVSKTEIDFDERFMT